MRREGDATQFLFQTCIFLNFDCSPYLYSLGFWELYNGQQLVFVSHVGLLWVCCVLHHRGAIFQVSLTYWLWALKIIQRDNKEIIHKTGEPQENWEKAVLRKIHQNARDRYFEKLLSVQDIDPYELTVVNWSADPALLPQSSYLDLANYFVYGISTYTSEQF